MEQAVRDRADAATAAIPDGNTPAAIRAQMAAISQEIQSLSATGAEDSPLGFATSEVANKEILGLERLLKSLELPLAAAIDELAVSIAEASRGPAETIRQAQAEVAEAIKAGLPGSRLFQLAIDDNAEQLSKAYKKLETAASGVDENNKPLSVDQKERLVKEARGQIDQLEASRSKIAAGTDAFAYERTVDPQRQIEARMGRARGNLNAAGLEDGRLARRMREIEAEREKIRRDSQMPENDNAVMKGFFEGRDAALNQEVAAIEAATIAIKIFADALNRASEEAKGNLNSAQQRADETRRADLGNSTPQTQEARRQAEADLERQRETERAAQTEIAVERDRLEQMQQPDAERMQQIDEELKSGRDAGQEERNKLAEQRAAVEAGIAADKKTADEEVARVNGIEDQLRPSQNKFLLDMMAMLDESTRLGVDPNAPIREHMDALKTAGKDGLVDEAQASLDAFNDKKRELGLDVGFDPQMAVNEADRKQREAAESGAAKLAEIDAQIAATPESSREDLIREREALQAKMEDDARASQAKVDSARDASTREAEQARAGERGRELTRTPEERFKAETEQGLADIQTYFERRAEDNNGLRPEGDIAAQAAAEARFRKDREKEARTATSEGRGAELGMTERDRFRRDFKEGAGKDINARAKELRDRGEDPTKFLRQAMKNQIESAAPMLQGFQEERQNALLQGPSRAALNVSDVSTSQGASELTRLIRGDDSAKDVNLVELRKQSGFLEDIANNLKENNPGVLL
jgi:hypothetical protein